MKRMKFERKRSRRWQAAAAKIRKVKGGNLWSLGVVTVYAVEGERTFEEIVMRPKPIVNAMLSYNV